ncbi:MAG: hypothetical protein WBL67_18510 [Nitrososphaeraceae archaeon]
MLAPQGTSAIWPNISLYCEPIKFLPIFTRILDQEGSDVTGKEVNVGTIVHDTATLYGHFMPPYEGKVTYLLCNGTLECFRDYTGRCLLLASIRLMEVRLQLASRPFGIDFLT